MKYKIGLVLSGGGARGIAHLGIIKALEELGLKPDVISGTSAGAIAGAFYSAGYSMHEILEIVQKGNFFNFSTLLFRKPGLFSMKSFEGIYEQYFKTNSFLDLKIPLHVCATDIADCKVVYFSSGDLSHALMASSCIPLVFEPILFHDALFVDGGVLNNFPIEPLQNECQIIIGSHVNSLQKGMKEIHMNEIADRSFHLALSSTVQDKKNLCTLFIDPPDMSQFSIFDLKKSEEIFDYGYKYALSIKEQILKIKI